jgi:hypothetical protein
MVSSTYITLHGDTQNIEAWHFRDHQRVAAGRRRGHAAAPRSDALITGRHTYGGMAPSSMAGTDEFADQMNAIRKCVVSFTPTDPVWPNTVVLSGDDVVEQIRRIKRCMVICLGPDCSTEHEAARGRADERRVREWASGRARGRLLQVGQMTE